MAPEPAATRVVFVNYHSESLVEPRVDALASAGFPITVVDNSGTFVAGGADVIDPGRNVGFGAACNLALQRTSEPFICLHNPDVTADPDDLIALSAHLERQMRPGAAAPALKTQVGIRQLGFRYPSPTRELARSLAIRKPALRPAVVPRSDNGRFASGALMLLSTSAMHAVSGFDERYFMYVEDADLWRTFADRGFTTAFHSGIVVEHDSATGSPASAGTRELLRRVGVQAFLEKWNNRAAWRRCRKVHEFAPVLAACDTHLKAVVQNAIGSGSLPSAVSEAVRRYMEFRR